jgi:hypothetical protein
MAATRTRYAIYVISGNTRVVVPEVKPVPAAKLKPLYQKRDELADQTLRSGFRPADKRYAVGIYDS